MLNLLIIGNGYDLGLGTETTFSNFAKDHEKLIKDFKNLNDEIFLEVIKESKMLNESISIQKFNEIFSSTNIQNWNDIENILGFRAFSLDEYNRYKLTEIIGLEEFLEEFSKIFKIWLLDKVKEITIPQNIDFIDSYTENDIVINLNYTDTIPNKYNKIHKVHYLDDEYCLICNKSIKMNNKRVISKMKQVKNELDNYISDQVISGINPKINIYIYGVSFESHIIVDEHISKFIGSIEIDYISEVKYINLKTSEFQRDKIINLLNINGIDFIDVMDQK